MKPRPSPRLPDERDLPARIAVGGGTSLFLKGFVSGPESRSVERIFITYEGERHPVIGHGGRASRADRRKGRPWWGLLSLEAVEAPRSSMLRIAVELKNGTTSELDLGEVELRPGLGVEYDGELGQTRRRARAMCRRARLPEQPLVAIAMATHRPARELLERQIASIQAQSHEAWVCLISDDASTPESVAEIEAVIGDDPRFLLWPSVAGRGPEGNFERALSMVPENADLVAPADQADYWYPQKLEVLCSMIADDTWLAFADRRLMSAADQVASGHECDPKQCRDGDLQALLSSNYVPGTNSVLRREVLDYALPFPPAGSAGRYDHWLAATASAHGRLAFEDALLADHYPQQSAAGDARDTGEGARDDGRRAEAFRRRARMLVVADVLRIRGGEELSEDTRRTLDAALAADRRRGPRLAKLAQTPAVSPSEPVAADGNGSSARPSGRPLAVEVRDLHKSFGRQEGLTLSWKSQLRHPFRRFHVGSLPVLEGVSFEIERGELFGILGRNGSGKSTLLKILAGIYGFDSGTVRVSPRVAPVIELGVGFQMEFPAYKNVVLNAELMGISEREAKKRFDSIIEFAGLEPFVDLRLRNYSSGMRARLAFSLAMQVDADLILLDEVLAVGDVAFQRKCEKVLDERQASGETTVILVSQQPSKIQRHCDRALLIEGGRIETMGDPADVARRYAELTLEGHGFEVPGPEAGSVAERARFVDLRLEDEAGERVRSVRSGEGIRLCASIETSSTIEEPGMRLEIRNRANAKLFAPPTLSFDAYPSLAEGEVIEIETGIENKLAPGPYTVNCTLTGVEDGFEKSVSRAETVEFVVVEGPVPTTGVIDLDHSVRVSSASKRRAAANGG